MVRSLWERTIIFRRSGFVKAQNEKILPKIRQDFIFGDPERTRTVDLQRDRLAC